MNTPLDTIIDTAEKLKMRNADVKSYALVTVESNGSLSIQFAAFSPYEMIGIIHELQNQILANRQVQSNSPPPSTPLKIVE